MIYDHNYNNNSNNNTNNKRIELNSLQSIFEKYCVLISIVRCWTFFQALRKTSNFGVQTFCCVLKVREGTQRRLHATVPLNHNLVAKPAVTVKKIFRKMIFKMMRY